MNIEYGGDGGSASRQAEKFCQALTHSFPGKLEDVMNILFFNFSYRPKPMRRDPL